MHETPGYHLTEDQHTALYQVRHVLGLITNLSQARDEFVDSLRYESQAVTTGLLCDMLDQVQSNLVWRKAQ